MRHVEFTINIAARDAWLNAMRIAVDGVELDPALKDKRGGYLEMAAHSMVNQPD